MENIRVGIVGIGNIGSVHAKTIYGGRIEGMRLCAICDTDAERLAKAGRDYAECATFSDYREMVKSGKIDALIVSTPHPHHAEIGSFALECGLHVLVEKPADISVSAAEKLNAAARKSGKSFCIMFNQRTNPLFQKAREIVRTGKLGELKRSVWIITNWYRTQHYYDSGAWRATWLGEGGGVLLNQAPHNLDLWQWVCGMPKSIVGFCNVAKYHNIEVEDDVTIFAELEGGATGAFITTTGENPGTNRLEISGTLGKLVLEEGKLKWWRLCESERDVCFSSEEIAPCIEKEYTEYTDDSNVSGHVLILQNFADNILLGTPLLAPGEEGINELSISNAAYLSAWTGNKKVELPLDSRKFDKLLRGKMKSSSYKEKTASVGETHDYSARWQTKW